MSKTNIKKSIFAKLRNNFIAGIVVLIPIGITLYLTLFLIRISGKVIPKEINPNNYLPFNISREMAITPAPPGRSIEKRQRGPTRLAEVNADGPI